MTEFILKALFQIGFCAMAFIAIRSILRWGWSEPSNEDEQEEPLSDEMKARIADGVSYTSDQQILERHWHLNFWKKAYPDRFNDAAAFELSRLEIEVERIEELRKQGLIRAIQIFNGQYEPIEETPPEPKKRTITDEWEPSWKSE